MDDLLQLSPEDQAEDGSGRRPNKVKCRERDGI